MALPFLFPVYSELLAIISNLTLLEWSSPGFLPPKTANRLYFFFTTRTGQGAWPMTRSAVEPSSSLRRPVRPWLPFLDGSSICQ